MPTRTSTLLVPATEYFYRELKINTGGGILNNDDHKSFWNDLIQFDPSELKTIDPNDFITFDMSDLKVIDTSDLLVIDLDDLKTLGEASENE